MTPRTKPPRGGDIQSTQGKEDWGTCGLSTPDAGLPSSRKMRSYWRESSGGLRG